MALKLSHFFHTNPPIFHKTYFLYGGQNTISDDLLEVETQKYAFRLILGWGIQKWNPSFDILKILPPAVTSH